MFDIDTINQINAETKQEQLHERKIKNTILSMTNPKRKAVEWKKNFPTQQLNETNLIF